MILVVEAQQILNLFDHFLRNLEVSFAGIFLQLFIPVKRVVESIDKKVGIDFILLLLVTHYLIYYKFTT